MGKKIRLIIALAVVIGALFWGYDTVRQRHYSGAKIAFEVGTGQVAVTNPGNEAIPVEMRSAGRTSSFRIASAELGLREGSKRVGSGRDVYHAIALELPPGTTRVDVTRGSNVRLVSPSEQRIEAVVTPLGETGARMIIIFAGLVALAGLYYISGLYEHRWFPALRSRLPQMSRRLRRT